MKLLVSGDVKGNFKLLFSKVNNILKKNGSFEMLLCVGEFFSDTPECKHQWEDLVSGRETAPIPIFILGPTMTEHLEFFSELSSDGGELCSNVTCLGQRGVYTTSSGLTIAYLSGKHDYDQYKRNSDGTKMLPHFTEHDITTLESQCKDLKGADILMTSDWPRHVHNLAQPPEDLDMKHVGAQPLDRMAYNVRPRYHFAALHQNFYERIPYRNHEVLRSNQSYVTRFIGLANVGNPDRKNRFIYAFSVEPMSTMDPKELTRQPPAVTDNPYAKLLKGKTSGLKDDIPEQNFFFDERAIRKRQHQQQGGRAPKKAPVPRGPCWFCLGSEQVEKHLVVSIGEQTYVALPKGSLVPEHVLILPIAHHPASTDIPEEVMEEIKKFKTALRAYYRSKKRNCVIFERNFRSQHLQLQVVPVKDIPAGALRQAFIDHGKTMGFQMNEVPSETPINELAAIGDPYFIVEFDEGGSLFTRIKGRFPLQFGREVLASSLILNVPERTNWKDCPTTKEEETAGAEKMRKHFQPFDFTDD